MFDKIKKKIFSGVEGDVHRFRNDRFVLLLEAEEQKDVIRG